jgi:hypothetical protein
LLDASSDATTSPSCPDHTALNRPPTASEFVGSSVADAAAAAAGPKGAVEPSARPSLAVVVSALPPEWTKASRVQRVASRRRPTDAHAAAAATASQGSGTTDQRGAESEAERRARKRARRRRRQRGEKVSPPATAPRRQNPSDGPPLAPLPGLGPSAAGDSAAADGSIFLFHGAMTLLPLSATVCEFTFNAM